MEVKKEMKTKDNEKTISINKDLHQKLKIKAVKKGIYLKTFIENILQKSVEIDD